LIADSLGGRAIRRNLITGTRMQNVGANDGTGGMAYTERKVVNYLYEHHNGSVYYSANPVYRGKELLPRSVIVDVKSSDKKLNERVIVYNAAKGYKINYKKGMVKKANAGSSSNIGRTTLPGSKKYVLNTNTKRFHYPECASVRQMADHNKKTETTTREKLISEGYSPCGNCKP
jgi:DNA-entry nuclease